MQKLSFFKKHWSTLLILILIVLLLIPQTAMPIKVFVNKIIAFSPSEISKDQQIKLEQYHWELVDRNGSVVNLSQAEGKPVLINFWATWCPPCRAEMPSLQSLYDAYGDQVAFYFVSQEDSNTQLKFLNKKEYQLPIFTQIAAPPVNLEVSVLPTTFLIDAEGTILMREEGAKKWDSEPVKKLLDQLIQ